MAQIYSIAMALLWAVSPVALTVGTAMLRKAGRSGAWWSMLCGALLCTTCGIVVVGTNLLSIFGMARNWDLYSGGWYSVFSLGSLLGNLLFVWGFVLYALKIVRLARRAEELERLTQAMAAEIQHQPAPAPGEPRAV